MVLIRKNKAVLGIYKTRTDMEMAVNALKNDGFSESDISVLMTDKSTSHDFVHTKSSKAPEGATVGAGAGAVIGGAIGLLAGIGILAVPGLGIFIAAGPIMAALAGIGIGGAVGGISGALIGFGIPEYEARRYEGFVKKGGILLSVHTDNSEEIEKAKNCLERTGAEDIVLAGETRTDWKILSGSRKETESKRL